MGYRPMWNAQRRLCGVQLFLHDLPDLTPDVAHLLHLLEGMSHPAAPRLLLSPQSPTLLQAMLARIRPSAAYALEVRGAWLAQNADLQRLASIASAQGVRLVWRGSIAELPSAQLAQFFSSSLLRLRAEDALEIMRLPLLEPLPPHLMMLRGQMYEGLMSQAGLRRCLDQYSASALAGWPDEDVLYRLRHQGTLQPAREHVAQLIAALDANHSVDRFEEILSHDPLLAWNLMVYVNSDAVGARSHIDSLRHAIVMLGFEPLKRWLTAQLPHTSQELDLQPARLAMVMRAHLTAELLNPGASEELRAEIYLCGLFSRIDQLLGLSLPQCLAQLPLSSRIALAHVEQDGPYASGLLLAQAMEREDAGADIQALVAEHEFDLERINRVLLRQIMSWPAEAPAW